VEFDFPISLFMTAEISTLALAKVLAGFVICALNVCY
jgi:hypothetical protein